MLKKGCNFAFTLYIIAGVEGGLQGLSGPDVNKAQLQIAVPPPSNLALPLRKALN